MSYCKENRHLAYSVNPRGWFGRTSDSPSIPFHKQACLIPHKFKFKSPGDLVKTIITTVDSDSSGECFLYFHGVITEHDFEMIEKELKAAALRTVVRFTFENLLDATILRTGTSVVHELSGLEPRSGLDSPRGCYPPTSPARNKCQRAKTKRNLVI